MKLRKRSRTIDWLLFLGLSLLLTGCIAESSATVQPVPTVTIPDFEEPAALEAQLYLAGQLDVPVQEVTILDYSAEEWPDACLGLAQPDEVCASVITPGFRVELSYQGQKYTVRTNDDTSVVRVETPAEIEVDG